MSKRKTIANNTKETQSKINVLNKRINKQRKQVIKTLKNTDSAADPLLKNQCDKLDKMERERIGLQSKLKK
tara:strand:- start:307 stop:519 length:213 start_codon:yes stop_codon:yes gene_type:complete